jgi:hypothetical protein
MIMGQFANSGTADESIKYKLDSSESQLIKVRPLQSKR